MIDIVILCPIAIEYAAVRSYLIDLSAHKIFEYELFFEIGNINLKNKNWTVALFETGAYIDNVQLKTFQILHKLQPNFAFLVGVAGGIKDVNLGDLVIGTVAYGYEYGKVTPKGIENRTKAIPFSESLIAEAKQLNREFPKDEYQVIFGPINSGNKVITSLESEQFKIIRAQYGDTIAVEMEAIGFAFSAAKMRDIAFLNIRGISDLIAQKTESDDNGSQQTAAKRAAHFVFNLITRLPKMPKKQVVETVDVFLTQKLFSAFSNRQFSEAKLHFSENIIALELKQKTIYISNIVELKHLQMPGDFAKNWVSITLSNDEKFYCCEQSSLPGLGSVFGGGKPLWKRLKHFCTE